MAGAVSVDLDEGPRAVATQTLTFSSADIDGSAVMAPRPGDVRAGVVAGGRRLFRAGLAAHGG